MQRALAHVVSLVTAEGLSPAVATEAGYVLSSEFRPMNSSGLAQAYVVAVGRPEPWDPEQFVKILRAADDRLRVGGYMVLSCGYRFFDYSAVAKRYKANVAFDRVRIRQKISAACTPWLQRNTQTADEHYTYLFDEAARLFGSEVCNKVALSFGCSTGEEVRCLKKRGFAAVHGVEINPTALEQARSADPEGIYVEDLADLPLQRYDLIFTVAVLCSFPSRNPVADFPFSLFTDTIATLDSRLNPGGYLIIGSVQYDFRDVPEIASRYVPILLDSPFLRYTSGRVPKWSPEGYIRPVEATTTEGAVPVVFQKLS